MDPDHCLSQQIGNGEPDQLTEALLLWQVDRIRDDHLLQAGVLQGVDRVT